MCQDKPQLTRPQLYVLQQLLLIYQPEVTKSDLYLTLSITIRSQIQPQSVFPGYIAFKTRNIISEPPSLCLFLVWEETLLTFFLFRE